MGDVGVCWGNAVVERFCRRLKHDWIFKVAQPRREHMKHDVTAYMRCYHQEKLRSSNGDMSPVEFGISQVKVSCLGWTEQLAMATKTRLIPHSNLSCWRERVAG
ncbi:MAG: putative transposase [Rubritalea sp.]|jgi:putative transposase